MIDVGGRNDYFEWGVALHGVETTKYRKGEKSMAEVRKDLRIIGKKIGKQVGKDYVVFPAATFSSRATGCIGLRQVDAINTFRITAGPFALFRVVSRTQIPATTQVSAISALGSIPGSSTKKAQVRENNLEPGPCCFNSYVNNQGSDHRSWRCCAPAAARTEPRPAANVGRISRWRWRSPCQGGTAR